MPRSASHALFLMLLPALLGTKCITYKAAPLVPDGGPDGGQDASMEAGADVGVALDAPEGGAPDVVIPPPPPELTPENMKRAACLADRCRAGAAVRYWKDDWNLYHVVRVITFRDPDAATSRFEVTDGDGTPATLDFDFGLPVTLQLVSPGDGTATAAHDFTAPAFARSVAWRDVETDDGEYVAPYIDAVLPTYAPGVEHIATLRFVPIVEGTFPVYSSSGVTDGTRYAEIAAGEVTPALNTGDAGKGMATAIHVTSDPFLEVFQETLPDRSVDLDRDPRRDGTDAVWTGAGDAGPAVQTVGIEAQEGLDPMTGLSVFTFVWTTRTLTQNVGHVLELTSRPSNVFQHNFTALGLFADSVVRRAVDNHAEIRAPYLASTNIAPGATIQLWVVPTVAADYQAYCQIGVVFGSNGTPDLATGHAGAGMLDTIVVAP